MKIIDTKTNTTTTINPDGCNHVKDVLSHLNINPETVVVAVNGQLVGDDHPVQTTDEITLYSVISGG